MKCTIPEIAWHNRDPVLSLDIQQTEESFYRLATSGTDCHVLIWHLRILDNGAVEQEVVSDLTRHQRSVNAVKWSHLGKYLASGDDDATIILWTLKTDNVPLLDGDNEKENKEIWNVFKVLRGHKEDVYDICWSPDDCKLLSGSIDNTAILWDVQKGKNELILKDHKGFVQGCAWDPTGQLIATLSSDRICRVFNSNGNKLKARIGKGKLPVPESHHLFDKEVKYFHDDTFKSYFRRLSFSPDGNMLIAPSGCVETEDCKRALYVTYIFTVNSIPNSAVILPSPKQCTVAAKCCPLLFELRPECGDPVVDLPYRVVIAIATDCDIILYDTQQAIPFAVLQNIHYTRLTDLSWSKDGRLLAASSTDGFCTLITFEPEELGHPYVKEEVELEDSVLNISGCTELDQDDVPPQKMEVENSEVEVKVEIKPKKPSFLEQWTIKTPKRASTPLNDKLEASKTIESNNKELKNDVIDITDSPIKENECNKPTVKRINPIKVTDSSSKEKSEDKGAKKRIVPISLNETPNKKIQLKTVAETLTPKSSTLKSSSNNDKRKARANPLDSFIQKIPSAKQKQESPMVMNKENKAAELVQVLDEVEARDAWKVEAEYKATVSSENANKEILRTIIHDKTLTDAPDDFKLSVDESLSESDASKATGSNQDVNLVKTPRRVPFVTISTKVDMKTSPEKSTVDEKKTENAEMVKELPKTPRRVPLITLSSPHHKKKKSA